MAKIKSPPSRNPCICTWICLGDIEGMGRYCKMQYREYFEKQAKKHARETSKKEKTNA